MLPFWENVADLNDLTVANYSGGFTEILDLLEKVFRFVYNYLSSS